MDQFTHTENKTGSSASIKYGDPGYLNNFFHAKMKKPGMPQMVTSSVRPILQTERKEDGKNAWRRTYKWFTNKYLPLLEEMNGHQPLDEDIIEWLNNYLFFLIAHDKYNSIPPNAVPAVCKFANDISTRFQAPRPKCLITPTSHVVWYSMVLLGENGRVFPFSGEAFANALSDLFGRKINSMTLYRIRDTLLDANCITQVEKGLRGGKCGTYKLNNEFHHLWENLGIMPKEGSSPISAEEIKKMFPWIFQAAN